MLPTDDSPRPVTRQEHEQAERLLAMGANENWGAGDSDPALAFTDTPWVPPAWKRRRKVRARSVTGPLSRSPPSVSWYGKFGSGWDPPPVSLILAANPFCLLTPIPIIGEGA